VAGEDVKFLVYSRKPMEEVTGANGPLRVATDVYLIRAIIPESGRIVVHVK
jgi:hypothetical protein